MFQSFIQNFTDSYVKPRIDKLMRASGEAMQTQSRELCPVDTGQLRDSIGYTYNADTKTVSLYADKHYAAFIEFGYVARNGRVVPPKPFLRPAMYAASKIWGITIEFQMPGLAPKYHERTVNHAASMQSRNRRVTAGHKRFR